MTMLTTTFDRLKDAKACEPRYKHLAKSLGGITAYGRTKPITLAQIFEHNGLDDAIWAFRAVVETEDAKRIAVEWACSCAERVLELFEKQFPDDSRPRGAIEAARKYAACEISRDELDKAIEEAREAARGAADAAARAADAAARAAAWAAARAADAAAREAAWAADAAAREAAWAAAAWAAARAADAAAREAARAAEKEWQKAKLLELLDISNTPEQQQLAG